MPKLPVAPKPEYAPSWAPIYPRDAVHGSSRRSEPVAWLCPDGHRHPTRQCVTR